MQLYEFLVKKIKNKNPANQEINQEKKKTKKTKNVRIGQVMIKGLMVTIRST